MFKQIMVILVNLSLGFSALAAENLEGKTVAEVKNTSAFTKEQFKGYLGLGAGYTAADKLDNTEGVPTSLKILGSYALPSKVAVFDLGLGFSNQQFRDNSALESAATGTALEAAARYQWANRWQAGVVVNDLLNQGKYYEARQADAHFAGLQVLKELDINQSFTARLGARALTETNPIARAVNMFLVDVQIGWGASSQPQVKAQEITAAPVVAPATVQAATQDQAQLTLLLNKRFGQTSKLAGNAPATFKLAKHNITPADKNYLNQLASQLKTHSHLYSSIVIRGYADKSGKEELNNELSKKRADAVAQLLQQKVGSSVKIETVGMGSAHSQAKVAKDRRVEIEFIGVKNQAELKKALENIKL